ncbi:MAG: RecQ family ATP-dependent DNA helicase, partial [Oscillospiraceae bacterium]|nr:RecQ family ATP-dependent DNA helicase [Oscillospiraceae bacterium]
SLMKDQVHALLEAGIPAAYINSSLTPAQQYKVIQNAKQYKYKLIYVAPERLELDFFQEFAASTNISFVSIDEAHCVSQWGQDFRPSYLKIAQFIQSMPKRPIIGAFTATATREVKDDIISFLALQHPFVMTTGFDRKNLYFEVQKPVDKFTALERFLERNPNKTGIIYCTTRKGVEYVCDRLILQGYRATRYHAGLSDKERKINQEEFQFDKAQIMVATNAFGMGIDKSNISYVIHFNMPKNIESYYQEAGRAGRDGEPAQCILLYSKQDVSTNLFLIEKDKENEELDPITRHEVLEKDRDRLKQMTYYCTTTDCLRAHMLRYFGEQSPNFCGNCSNCNANSKEIDITVEAQKIMSCIIRAGERFGMLTIIDILRGSKNEKIRNSHLDTLTTYGIMESVPKEYIRQVIEFLLVQSYIQATTDGYQVLKIQPKAYAVLRGQQSLHMRVLQQPDNMESSVPTSYVEIDEELFQQLKALRAKIAKVQSVPAFVIFTDAALRDMCIKLPQNLKSFLEVNGVGQTKANRYGERFIKLIQAYCQKSANIE